MDKHDINVLLIGILLFEIVCLAICVWAWQQLRKDMKRNGMPQKKDLSKYIKENASEPYYLK